MSDGSLALTLVRAVISLALVLGLLVVCLRVMARRGGFAPAARQATVPVDVVGRRQLGRGSSVQVVRVGRQTLVLGVTDAEVSVLTHLSADDVSADESDEVESGSPAGSGITLFEAVRGQGRVGALAAGLPGMGDRSRGGRHRGGSRV